MSNERAPLPPINFEALARALVAQAHILVPMWLPGGVAKNNEYLVHSVWRSEKTPSLSVRLAGAKAGHWSDFGGDERGGDLISLYARVHGLDMGHAAVRLARDLGLEDVAGVQRDANHQRAALPPPPPPPPPADAQGPAKADREGWQPMMPVPANALAATFWHQYRKVADITHTAVYRLDGHLLGYVVRFRTSDGGKEVLPYVWCKSERDGGMAWKWRQWDVPRPLYLPGGAKPEQRTVVLVEGEKKADALHNLLEAGAPGVYCVASWPGGSNAWNKASWEWLAGATVLLWPDCDGKREKLTGDERKEVDAAVRAAHPELEGEALREAVRAAEIERQQTKPLLPAAKQTGNKAMLGIGAHLQGSHGCTVQMLTIPAPGAVADGWDCGDAIETDGWGIAEVLAFFSHAQPLPAADAGDGAGAGAGGAGGPPEPPKNNGPVGTEGGDDASAGRRRAGEPKGMPDWLRPYWDADKRRWLTSRKLVIKALHEDEALAGVLAFNRLTNNIDARRAWPWAHGTAGAVRNSVDLMLGSYLSDAYGLPSIARTALAEGMETVAFAAPYHPVCEYLDGLQWDGKPRLDKWLMHVIGEKPETVPKRVAEYLALVGRFFVMGLVARVLEPGCKFDYCLVLEGKGGRYKSTALKTLVGREWFSDTRFDVQKNKEAQEQVQGVWLYELGELAHFNKAGVDEIKAFVSSEVDRYRPAYGRIVESFPRQCVLAATTNNRKYLRDKTGNRRFWPVPVAHVINVAWIAKYRDQLFAEALQLVRAGERHWPDEETEVRLFVPMQQERMVVDAVEEELLRVLTRSPAASGIGSEVNELTTHVSVAQLIQALGVDVGKANAGLQSQIRGWLEQEGWDQKKVPVGGVRLMRYVRPAVWPLPDEDEPADDAPTGAPPDGDGAGVADAAQAGGAEDDPF